MRRVFVWPPKAAISGGYPSTRVCGSAGRVTRGWLRASARRTLFMMFSLMAVADYNLHLTPKVALFAGAGIGGAYVLRTAERGCLRYPVQRLCGILRDAARWLRMLEPAARHAGLHLYGAGQPPSVAHVRNKPSAAGGGKTLILPGTLVPSAFMSCPSGVTRVTARGGGGDVADDVPQGPAA